MYCPSIFPFSCFQSANTVRKPHISGKEGVKLFGLQEKINGMLTRLIK